MPNLVSTLPCFLLQLVILNLLPRVSSIRKGIGFGATPICRHTVQGRYLLSDDKGHVCEPLAIDPESRCCPKKGDRYSCKGCSLLSNCCDSYEYCVSCCMNPSTTSEDEATKVSNVVKIVNAIGVSYIFRYVECIMIIRLIMNVKITILTALKVRIAKTSTSTNYSTLFDYCEGRCRHNSASVVHENAYISNFHHCFYLPSSALEDNATRPVVLEGRLAGVSVVIGQRGESCDSTCESNGQSCVVNKLLVLNECDVMKKYLGCEGGCLASMGSDQPAEVVDDAPKELSPGACLFTKALSMISCDGWHNNTRRVCPCA